MTQDFFFLVEKAAKQNFHGKCELIPSKVHTFLANNVGSAVQRWYDSAFGAAAIQRLPILVLSDLQPDFVHLSDGPWPVIPSLTARRTHCDVS